MTAFEVRINGQNFLVEQDNKLDKYGFYTNLYTEAADEEDAEIKAIEMIRNHQKLKTAVKNDKSDPPSLYIEEIKVISKYEEIEPKIQGLIWYLESEDESV